ncbi:MAG: hypothetical protein H0V46_01795 [Sphingomonas sp.]|nr:hypothetical protein [Sphingomonas sp.]
MRRPTPTVIALIAGVFVLLLLVYVFTGSRGGANRDKLSDDQVAGGTADDPEQRCGSQRTYDLIKRELFRRAAQVRGSEQAAFDRLSAYSVVRMDAPMLRGHDKDLGRVECAGTLALDLPPGVSVVGGRRTLNANIGYALQRSADGNGEILTLTSAEGIIAPLATLARVGSTTGDPLVAGTSEPVAPGAPSPTNDPFAAPPPPPQPPVQSAPSPPPPGASASPSFNCRNARTRGEIAVCGDSGLASLDRQMASQFNSAMSGASSSERALLQRTRGRFLSFRDSCRSDSCIADAYRGRMREIQDIREGRWRGQ